MMNDENVLMKLAEMSMTMTNDESLSNIDLKTGAISSTGNNFRNLRKQPISESCFNLMENEIKFGPMKLSSISLISEEENKNELNKYLKSHNIRDGNLVSTRRIDLRQFQNPQTKTEEKKKTLESLNVAFKDWTKGKTEESSFSSSSSESSADEENDSSLWIERYRKQKFAYHK